jgi:hypothetical protein
VAVELPDPATNSYLRASKTAALYIARGPGGMLRIGPSTNLRETYSWLRGQNFQLEWVVWCDQLEVAVWLAGAPLAMFPNIEEPIIVSAELDTVVKIVERVAEAAEVIKRVSRHDQVMDKTRDLSRRARAVMDVLKGSGVLRDFNDAYRAKRLAEEAEGRKFVDYRLIEDQLWLCLSRALANDATVKQAADRLRQEFPWLANTRNHKTVQS